MPRPFERLDPALYRLPAGLPERLCSPALVIFMEQVRHNVRTMLGHVGEPGRWRPHVKTTKLPPVWNELFAAGLEHFKCATVREARLLLGAARASGREAVDIQLAYPRLGPELELLGNLASAHPAARLSVLCEDPADLPSIPASLGIFIDVNPGMHRTGIPVREAPRVLAVARAAGARLRGVHYYDGHLHAGDAAQRRRDVFRCLDELLELLASFDQAGLEVAEVTTSGTPTFLQALQYARLRARPRTAHRVSPGTVVFHDARSEEENRGADDEGLGLRPAALVFTRVVSRPTGGIVTCDAGSKSLAAEAGDPCAVVLGRAELEALAPSEEHLPLRVTAGAAPARGAELLLIPRHVCPTVNLAEQAVLLEADGSWSAVPVSARAHDLLAS